jgi:hypothetical protein
MKVVGNERRPDWPKLGPSIIIATALIVAIRTAKWVAKSSADAQFSDIDVELGNARTAPTARKSLPAARRPDLRGRIGRRQPPVNVLRAAFMLYILAVDCYCPLALDKRKSRSAGVPDASSLITIRHSSPCRAKAMPCNAIISQIRS